jgi:hypothetical protein
MGLDGDLEKERLMTIQRRVHGVFWILFLVLLSAITILSLVYGWSPGKLADEVRAVMLVVFMISVSGLCAAVGIYGSECYAQGLKDARPPYKD